MEGACPYCGAVDAIDQSEGFAACQSCGAVLEDAVLQHERPYQEQQPLGVSVRHDDTGEGALAMLHAIQPHPAFGVGQPSRSSEHVRKQRLKKQLREYGNRLRLPAYTLEQAESILMRVVDEGESNPGVQHPVLLGAVLHLAARDNRQALTVKDVSGVVERGIFSVSKESQRLNRALSLDVSRPNLVQLMKKHAGTLVQARFPPAAAEDADHHFGFSVSYMLGHPVYQSAVALAEVVAYHEIGESYSPQAIAGYLLYLSIKSHLGNQQLQTMSHDVARQVSVGVEAVYAAGRVILEELQNLARATPIGPYVSVNNIGSFSSILLKMTHASAALQ